MRAWRSISLVMVLATTLASQQPTVVIDGFDASTGAFPTAGESTTISLSEGSPTGVEVTYRPSSLVSTLR